MTENEAPVSDAPASTQKINHVALWAMITGIAGFTFGWFIPAPWSLAAVVLGHIGLAQTKGQKGTNRGFAITGLVTGYVGIALVIAAIFAIVAAIGYIGFDEFIRIIETGGDFDQMPGMMND